MSTKTEIEPFIQQLAARLGFQQVGISDVSLENEEIYFQRWLQAGYHGEMYYLQAHENKRSQPALLVPGTLRAICLRMDYLPQPREQALAALDQSQQAYISRYTLGRDYHKVVRKRLQQFAMQLAEHIGPFGYRVFCDSAPVFEKALAEKAGLGWTGKHTLLVNQQAGSFFFLGEIYIDAPLPPTTSCVIPRCGSCTRCLRACPTGAIIAPYTLDARRCISYLTIELKGAIPVELRPLLGNRIFGCDDCQLVCPWNRYAQLTQESDFAFRYSLDQVSLVDVFHWSEAEFLQKTEGMAIRRTGYSGWLRNIAVALGNALRADCDTLERQIMRQALQSKQHHVDEIVQEHILWALDQSE